MATYDATIEHLRKHGLERKDARRLFTALCTLADYEGTVKRALRENVGGASEQAHQDVCAALRWLVDGK